MRHGAQIGSAAENIEGVIGECEAMEWVAGAAVEAGLTPNEALAAAHRGLRIGRFESSLSGE